MIQQKPWRPADYIERLPISRIPEPSYTPLLVNPDLIEEVRSGVQLLPESEETRAAVIMAAIVVFVGVALLVYAFVNAIPGRS